MCLALGVPASGAEPAQVRTFGSTYLPGDDKLPLELTVSQGQRLQYQNLDTVSHDIHSSVSNNGIPLFASEATSLFDRRFVEVERVASLPPGSYGFYCTHHPSMTGTLHVTS